jgi:hypothetical protein
VPRPTSPTRPRPSPTASSPARAEALGEDTAIATIAGRDWRIPLDVDTWPLDVVARCLVMDTKRRRIVVDHLAVAVALEGILGDQWDDFVTYAAPRRRDLVPASHILAEAVGLPADSESDGHGGKRDKCFGGLPRLLAVLNSWPAAVESDLNRFWGLDYRDRWRFDDHRRRRLTLRQIYTRISHLPADSALAVSMGRRSPLELLVMDVYEATAKQVHPARPLTPEQAAERHAEAAAKAKAMADYEARRAARGDRLPDRLRTARENAKRTRGA